MNSKDNIQSIKKSKKELIEQIDNLEINSQKQEFSLNKILRNLESEIHRIEQEKLEDYNPETH